MTKKDINYALVEGKRPPIYTAMKYWGKKPHNIWREYINNYTRDNEQILDPFSGSAIAAFEAVKCGKKAIAFDINPLTSFIIEVYASKFDVEQFSLFLYRVIDDIRKDEIYLKYFTITCPNCKSLADLQNFKWDAGVIYEIGIVCPNCGLKQSVNENLDYINDLANESHSVDIKYWFPDDRFYNKDSFSEAFIKNIGGNSFSDIWSKRNLYILSNIFNSILLFKDDNIKKQLLFGFIQCLHLCSKMCIPRSKKSNRAFSTSWGRPAYFCSKKQMEMNPLLLFQKSCLGKQSVESVLSNVEDYLGKIPKIKCVNNININEDDCEYDIKYGIVDIKKMSDYIKNETIDFIITDPPYGGLIQYLDLSQIWLVWLKKYDEKYNPSISDEITIKKDIIGLKEFEEDIYKGIKQLYKVLKKDGKIVFTFNNKDLGIWNAFLSSISKAGFKIEKVIHQQNKRTGEANVSNAYGTSATDFYIRCIKEGNELRSINDEEFCNFIVKKAIELIKARNEPTPYQILFNGLLAEYSKQGFDLKNFDNELVDVLKSRKDIFITTASDELSGNLWWLNSKYICNNSIQPLSERVEDSIKKYIMYNNTFQYEDILQKLFILYPNGLTPDIKYVEKIINKYAFQEKKIWKAKEGEEKDDGKIRPEK
jgi:16S rRNA G966 N2-methylase RsmD